MKTHTSFKWHQLNCLAVLLLTLTVFPANGQADIITLKDGTEYEGTLLKKNNIIITFEYVENQRVKTKLFPASKVANIKLDKATRVKPLPKPNPVPTPIRKPEARPSPKNTKPDTNDAAHIITNSKAATALVDLGIYGSGTGFCIREDGLFVTNRHVIRDAPIGTVVTLIMNPAEKNQNVAKARVVKKAGKADLALLKVDEVMSFKTLKLGSDDQLLETTAITGFGFPFGKAFGVQGNYPSISVNTGRITALRKSAGELKAIQLDAVMNPGNSGGPVVDKEGKVIGVIVSGVQGTGVNFAIPVSQLQRFLNEPGLAIKAPIISFAKRYEPTNFEIESYQFEKPEVKLDVEVKFGINSDSRTFKTTKGATGHTFTAMPLVNPKTPLELQLNAVIGEQSFASQTTDKLINVGQKKLLISEIRFFKKSDDHYIVNTVYGDSIKANDLADILAIDGKFRDASKIQVMSFKAGPMAYTYSITGIKNDSVVTTTNGIINLQHRPFTIYNSWGNLFPFFEPSKHTKRGNAKKTDGSIEILGESAGYSLAAIPLEIKGNYLLRLNATRREGIDSANIVLPVGSRHIMLILGGFPNGGKNGTISGLSRTNGNFANKNSTTTKRFQFIDGKTYEILIQVVTQQGLADIKVLVDKKPLIHWRGFEKSISLKDNFRLVDQNQIGLGCVNSRLRYDNVHLRLLSGTVETMH